MVRPCRQYYLLQSLQCAGGPDRDGGRFCRRVTSAITSIVFAMKITRQSDCLLPLLTGSTMAFITSALTMRNTITTEKPGRRGHNVPPEYVAALPLAKVGWSLSERPTSASGLEREDWPSLTLPIGQAISPSAGSPNISRVTSVDLRSKIAPSASTINRRRHLDDLKVNR